MCKIPVYGSGASTPSLTLPRRAIFRQDGDFWTLSYAQRTVRIRDIKGLVYIAKLLSQPDIEIHAMQLARVGISADEYCDAAAQMQAPESSGVNIGHLGDAGEMLDSQAKAAYRRRLSDLRDEQTEARAFGQIDRAEAAELEIDALITELSRATGLRGRNRIAASNSERARQSVSRAIRSALARIAHHHPALAQILTRQIKTGTFCSYQPDPNFTVRWSLAAANGDKASSQADRHGDVTMMDPVNGESAHHFTSAEVLGLILEPAWNAKDAMAEDALVPLDQMTSAIRSALLRFSSQLTPSKSTTSTPKLILLAVNRLHCADPKVLEPQVEEDTLPDRHDY